MRRLKLSSVEMEQICNAFNIIQISLDGPNEKVNAYTRGKGNFNKTISFAKAIKQRHLMGALAQPYFSCTFGQEKYCKIFKYLVEENLNYFFLFEETIGKEKVKDLSTKQFLNKVERKSK